MELVIVAPSRRELGLVAEEVDCFGGYQVVEVGEVDSMGPAMAAGVHAARAPVVVYAEQHSYPEPDWARVLIEKHQEPWAAVGWAIRNANPGTLTSWSHLFGQFGPVVTPVRSGPSPFLAGHHTCTSATSCWNTALVLGKCSATSVRCTSTCATGDTSSSSPAKPFPGT